MNLIFRNFKPKNLRWHSSSWEFIQPYPKDKKNPEYGAPEIPIPPPINRDNEPMASKKKRLIWTSRKRGILETDLLLSTFIKENIDKLTNQELIDYDNLLNENDWDIYYWATGAREVPERIKNLSFWNSLFEHCKNKQRKILRMPEIYQ